MTPSEKPFDVFISHSTQDALAASAIKQHLQASGLKCWKAPDDIDAGESWPSAITRALSMCRVMVLVWTSNSLASREVSKELTIAMRNGLTVIPFRIEDVQPTSEWDYHLANTHWMDAFPGDLTPFVQSLASRIQSVIGNPADSATYSSGALPRCKSAAVERGASGPRFPVGTIMLGLLLVIGGLGAWFFMRGAGEGQQPVAVTKGVSLESAEEVVALREAAQQARREKDEALRQASDKEAESLRQIAQRAEAEKQLALQRAEQAEAAAKAAQLEKAAQANAASERMDADLLNERGSNANGEVDLRRDPQTMNTAGSRMPIVATPEQTILNYFTFINSGDYQEAWRLLPDTLQDNKRIHPHGYASFEAWFRSLRPITISDVTVTDQSSAEASVLVDYRYMMSGKPSSETLKYTLAWNESTQQWQIMAVKKSR